MMRSQPLSTIAAQAVAFGLAFREDRAKHISGLEQQIKKLTAEEEASFELPGGLNGKFDTKQLEG